MCGIAVAQGPRAAETVEEMLTAIGHRGPDGRGCLAVGETVLGHVRLAIIDVAGGLQPMTNERGDLAVVFNGEIYNHLDLRHRLEAKHRFKTRSDTEVLLHLYEERADDLLTELDGMFAFALAGPQGILLARDPLGIKPLYFAQRDDRFVAASELRAFHADDAVQILPAGWAMRLGGRSWRFAAPIPPGPGGVTPSLSEILSAIRHRLQKAVVKRLMGDVPVGVYLSGGLDSSLVAAIMPKRNNEVLDPF